MAVLRIFSPLSAMPAHCTWLLFDDAGAHPGEGTLAQLPQGAAQVELVLAASQVLITRAQLPASSRRQSAALLAYAAEERLASDPDTNQVSRLGEVDGEGVLAVVNRQRLKAWRDALEALGIEVDSVYCETLMLPLQDHEWSLAWDGQEGHVRFGELEGGATDCGDRQTPPLVLQRLLDDARVRDALPTAVALYLTTPAAQPDLQVWQQKLGISIRPVTAEDWRMAPGAATIRIGQQTRPWRPSTEMLARWRRTAWVLLAALLVHAGASVADRVQLASEQQQLRGQMETRFRTLFPDALAVADPALQTRRKLAQARHVAHQPDDGDFPVMLAKVVPALAGIPTAKVHTLSYADGRMTLEFLGASDALTRQLEAGLVQAGFEVEVSHAATAAARGPVTLTLRSP